MSDLRDRVAAELEGHITRFGLDDPWSDRSGVSSRMLHSSDELYTAERLDLHARVVDEALAMRADVPRRRQLGVVVTAGPPGAGKSTALAVMPEFATFRHVDADHFKDALLTDAVARGDLADWLAHPLEDGRPISPRELASFVHAESTVVAEQMRERCLGDGENVVLHGTLSSTDHAEQLLAEFAQFDYPKITIVDVEPDRATALDQALSRWWQERTGGGPLGGRYVPRAVVQGLYPDGASTSTCSANAERFAARATDLGWAVDLRRLPTRS